MRPRTESQDESRYRPRRSAGTFRIRIALSTLLVAAMLVTVPGLGANGQQPIMAPAAELETEPAAADGAKASGVTIEQTTLGNIFVEGDTPTFTVRTEASRISWTVRDYWGGRAGSGAADGTRRR